MSTPAADQAAALAERERQARRARGLLETFVLREYRDEGGHNAHLTGCDVAVIAEFESSDGTYGCDTGCEYLTLRAVITCPHGEAEEFTYGEFGAISELVTELEELGPR